MANIYISRDLHTIETAKAMAVRGSVSFVGADSFEDEGECQVCGTTGPMLFTTIDSETAVADCPGCGWGVRKYTGSDAA